MSPKSKNTTEPTAFTIGHSNLSEKEFVTLLKKHGITDVVDVRSAPYSRYASQFNEKTIDAYLKQHDIKYRYLGHRLGGRSDDPSCYDPNGQIQYQEIASTEMFQEGLASVARGAHGDHRIALMCTEKQPEDCHRSLLVAQQLEENHELIVQHILPNGRLETHEEMRSRIAGNRLQGGLFADGREGVIAEAVEKQIQKIAYVDKRFAYAQDTYEPSMAGTEH